MGTEIERLAWIMALLVSSSAWAAESPSILTPDVTGSIARCEIVEIFVQAALPPGTRVGSYQLAIGYDPEVLEVNYLSEPSWAAPDVTDLVGDVPSGFTCVDADQWAPDPASFGRAVMCLDTDLIGETVSLLGKLDLVSLRFRVRGDATVSETTVQVLNHADVSRIDHLMGNHFYTPLVLDPKAVEALIDSPAVIEAGTIPIGAGTATFAQPVLATSTAGFEWRSPVPYLYVRGGFESSVDIGALASDVFGSGVGVSFSDPDLPTTPGSGYWYLWRPDCDPSSWTSGGPNEQFEPGRDAQLP